MKKSNIDTDEFFSSLKTSMAGKAPSYAMAPTALSDKASEGVVDTSAELNKRAAHTISTILDDAHPKSTDLGDIDHKVLTLEDQHKAILSALSMGKKAAVASFIEQLRVLEADLKKASFHKQAGVVAGIISKLS